MAFARLFYRVSFVLLALASVAGAQTITGRWDGTAKIADNFTVPVHLEISGAGSHVQGALILICKGRLSSSMVRNAFPRQSAISAVTH
jgi:hypothetical protein